MIATYTYAKLQLYLEESNILPMTNNFFILLLVLRLNDISLKKTFLINS